jgi:hypothetical protein
VLCPTGPNPTPLPTDSMGGLGGTPNNFCGGRSIVLRGSISPNSPANTRTASPQFNPSNTNCATFQQIFRAGGGGGGGASAVPGSSQFPASLGAGGGGGAVATLATLADQAQPPAAQQPIQLHSIAYRSRRVLQHQSQSHLPEGRSSFPGILSSRKTGWQRENSSKFSRLGG